MRLSVKVKANSQEEKLEKINNNTFLLWVKPPARENKANEAVINLLSKYFAIPKVLIKIIQGKNCKNKIIDLEPRLK